MLKPILLAIASYSIAKIVTAFRGKDYQMTTADYQLQFYRSVVFCAMAAALAVFLRSYMGMLLIAMVVIITATNYWVFRQSQDWDN